jgi:hypothetical protein
MTLDVEENHVDKLAEALISAGFLNPHKGVDVAVHDG